MERDQIHDFVWRKGRRMMWEKNKASSPRLALPLCLKTAVKQGRSALLGMRNKSRLAKYVSRMIPKRSITQFSKY